MGARLSLLLALAPAVLAACHGAIPESPHDTAAEPTLSGDTRRPPPGPSAGPEPPLRPGTAPALDPGAVVLRRLNRTEYDNTIRDLLGTALRPGTRLPPDEVSHGFDTLGDALALSPVRFEQLESAATELTDELFALPTTDPRRMRVLPCDPGAAGCFRKVLEAFMNRAFRRRVTTPELDRFVALAERLRTSTGTPEGGLRGAVAAVLLSPQFLYRVERGKPEAGSKLLRLDDYEIAARLSYFLWASMPDEALFAAAAAGKLGDPNELARQVTRMLDDAKAQGFVDAFGSQWLTLRRLPFVEPDPKVFPAFDPALRTSAGQESALFFQTLLREDRPVRELLLADFTFVNARLARHYGVAAPNTGFAKAALTETPRLGLLGHASFLMETSHPARTSPVKRGVWVLEQLLCAPPPPPPPNVENLAPGRAGATLREQLEEHRRNPACAGCHNLMDPIGLGLEGFDAIGAVRTRDNGAPLDTTGSLPGGRTFDGAAALARLLADDPRYVACVTQQLLTYGVGRAFTEPAGRRYATDLAEWAAGDRPATWRRLLTAVATSEAMRTRRPQEAP